MSRLLREIRANITPAEQEKVGLPSSVMRILPRAESLSKSNEPPVQVKRSEWERTEDPERLVRVYEFDDEAKVRMFVNEVLEYQQETGHHAVLTIREGDVKVAVWTHGLNQVTEVDTEYAQDVEDIYRDINLRKPEIAWNQY